MTWPRAAVAGAGIVLVAFLALVYVPDWLVSELSGVDRSTRVLIATTWFMVALVGLLWGLRRLQARGLRR